ncbi:MAG: glycoside hydrolase family 3 protein [Cyclobacteriaceae bacterium]|jgi:beta-N-acetylhexosaminidase|nr:glycoside hydrolase family 3 protein [Cyclobacteriaceae bacterium]
MKKYLTLALVLTARLAIAQPDSLHIKIGQMILIGMPEAKVDPVVLEEVRQGKVGTLILFEKNVPKSANAFAPLKKITWTYQQAAPIPLFIAIDQEGGKVNRLKEKYGFPRSVTARALGKAGSLDSVRFYAEALASNLAGLGINVNFAPCVDLAVNPNNTVIVKVERSFSPHADSVALLAQEYIKQHRKYGVITSLKHFPGHGSSLEDTHFGVADVTHTWSESELTPYQRLLDSGYVDAVMTSHIVNKKLDSKGLPGTLSKEILDGILRKKIGFDGVVFSDDMQMHAIAKQYGLEESIKLAINAGVDILCFSNNIAGSETRTVDRVFDIIRTAVEKGDIPRARIDQSFARIMALKGKLRQSEADYYRARMLQAEQRLAAQRAQAEQQNQEPRKQAQPEMKAAKKEEAKAEKKKKKKSR